MSANPAIRPRRSVLYMPGANERALEKAKDIPADALIFDLEDAEYSGAAAELPTVWIAVRANLRRVVERVTIADLAAGDLPEDVITLARDPGAWITR